ncbi:MAG: hypothetical protein ACRD96_17540, partial [Bryobacteraceae bacterium]
IVAQLMARELGLLPGAREPVVVDGSKKPVRFGLAGQVALPPVPGAPNPVPVDYRPVVAIRGLGPGRHVLRAGGREVTSSDAGGWARGVALERGPPVSAAESLRQAIIEKNKQFFYRWRAVNGEYIYGRRKEPFGIANFPGEMKILDGIIADLDGKILGLARALQEQAYELDQ